MPLATGTGGTGGTGGTSGSAGTGGTGGTSGSAGKGGTGGSGGTGGTTSADPARYGFESGTQAWATSGGMITRVASSTTRAFAGTRSLAATFNGAAGTQTVRVSSPGTPRSATVTYRVWVPSGSRITAVQPYVLQGAAGNWTWTGNWRGISALTTNAWNTITVTVPSNAAAIAELGVSFTTNATWSGTVYVDSVTW